MELTDVDAVDSPGKEPKPKMANPTDEVRPVTTGHIHTRSLSQLHGQCETRKDRTKIDNRLLRERHTHNPNSHNRANTS